jgi:hypothetical protein
MELFSSLLLVVTAIALVVYTLLTEGLDWIGRAEIIEKRWPVLWGAMNNRPTRLVLLVIALAMLANVAKDLRAGADPPLVIFAAPKVPPIDTNLKIIQVAAPSAPLIVNSHEVTSDKANVIKTEFIFVPSRKVPAPVEIEVTVDGPIYGIGQVDVAEASPVLTGNSRWNGNVAVLVISAPGLAPEHAAIAELYSNRRLRAMKARFLP